MGHHLPQIRPHLHQGRARAGILLLITLLPRVRDPDQSVVLVLSNPDHGRGPEHVPAVPGVDRGGRLGGGAPAV